MITGVSGQTSKGHHVIPQFLLRRFAADRSVLKQFDVTSENLTGSRVHVKSATKEDNFYVLDGLHGSYDYDEREIMGKLDDRAAKVLHRLWGATDLASVWPLDDADRVTLAQFLAALVLRTPRFRRHSQSVAEHVLRDPDRHPLAIDLFRNGVITSESLPIEIIRKYYGVWLEGEPAPPNFHAQVLRDHLNPLGQHLFEQRWILMRTPHPQFFLSDNPVALVDEIPRDALPRYRGLDFIASKASMVALDRGLLLVTEWHPMEKLRRAKDFGDQCTDFHEGLARMACGVLLGNADRRVFSHPDDVIIETFVSEIDLGDQVDDERTMREEAN